MVDRIHFKSFLFGVLASLFAAWGCLYFLHPSCRVRYSTNGPFGTGRMLVCTGRFAEGIDQLNRYVDAYPRGRNVSRAHLFLAKAHIGLNRTDKAKEIFNTILRDYPDSLEAHKARYKLAFMEYLEGNEAAALKGFESLAAGPDGPLCAEAAFFRDSIRAERSGER